MRVVLPFLLVVALHALRDPEEESALERPLQPISVHGGQTLRFPVARQGECMETNYLNSRRRGCDQALAKLLEPIYIRGNKFRITKIADWAFDEVWKCYANDTCYMSPSGPTGIKLTLNESKMSVEEVPGGSTTRINIPISVPDFWNWVSQKFTYVSFERWHSAMLSAMSESMEFTKGNPTYLAIAVGSPHAGDSGLNDAGISQELVQLPKLFFKSELWTLIHVLNALWTRLEGVIWFGESIEHEVEIAMNDTKAFAPTEKVINISDGTVIVPFDASYSGQQVGYTMGLVKSMLPSTVKVLGAIGVAQEGAKEKAKKTWEDIVVSDYNWRGKGNAKRFARWNTFPDLKLGMTLGSAKTGPLFVMQFKIPDKASVLPLVTGLLKCYLCCKGDDVDRPPYKFYTDRKQAHLCSDARLPTENQLPTEATEPAPSYDCKCE